MGTTFTVVECDYTYADDCGPLTDEFRAVSVVQGDLADKIRARTGAEPSAVVKIVEEAVDTSYSEWTRQSDYSFKLLVGDDEVDFERGVWDGAQTSIGRIMDWLECDKDDDQTKLVVNTFMAISQSDY